MNIKKSQISIFVIISAILILGMIVLLSTNFDKVNVFKEDKSSYKVQNFVESCLELESKTAINKIGQTGGWLYHPPMLFTNRGQQPIINKRAEGLNFLEKVEIPYWHYYNDVSEEFELNIPEYDSNSKYSMKNQLKKYVDDNLENNCLQSFIVFENQYKIKYEPREVKTEVIFENENIYVNLYLPIEIDEITNNNTEFVDTFKIKLDNKLLVPYLISRDITIAEANSSFIEKRVMSFITPYQSPDTRDLLPPFYDFKMKYDFRPWDVSKVETLVKQILNSNIGLLQFVNSNYQPEELPLELQDSEFAQGVYSIYVKDYISEHSIIKETDPRTFNKYKDYTVVPKFEPFFPMFFSLSPSMGNVILLPKPEAIMGFIPFFFTEYVATYEMSMPILFNIKDSTSNEKFTFNLALEANIAHNTPLKENYDFNFDLDALNLKNVKSLVCDPPQFISEFITLNITDPINYGNRLPDGPLTGVDGAIVTFDCKGISSCYVGESSIVNDSTSLKFRLPINCDPGTLEVYKFGHKKVKIENINPTLNTPINLGTFQMPSSKTLKVKAVMLDSGDSKFAKGMAFDDYDKGFLIFENKDDTEFTRVVEINKDNQYDLTIDLAPGNYTIKGFVTYDKEFTIKEEMTCYDGGCQTLPEMKMDAWVSAGVEIENFEITTKELLNREKITVNFIKYGVPTSYGMLTSVSEVMGDLKKLSENKKPYLD